MILVGWAFEKRVALLLALLFWVCSSGSAYPHASAVATVPANGAVLSASPDELSVEFTEPVIPIAVRLFDAAMSELALAGPPVMDGKVLRFTTLDPLPGGTFVASVRVTSKDGHPVGITFLFDVGNASLSGAQREKVLSDLDADPWRVPVFALRGVFYSLALSVCGGALFLCLVGIPASLDAKLGEIMRAGSVLGLLSALAFLALAGAQLQGADPRAVDLPAVADAARASANFERVVSAAIGFLIIAFASTGRFASRRRRLALGAGGLAIATSFAFASHVVAKSGSSFAYQVMIIAHIAMAAFWVGSLLPLFLILGDRERFYASAYLRAFSAIAGIGLLVIFATGAIMAMRLLNDFSELWTSDYGLRFGGKIAFILGLLLVATINRFFWTPRFELNTGKLAAHVARLGDRDFTRDTLRLAWDAQRPVRGLRNMISIDLVLAVGVVALTASLTLDQPPGAMGQMADRGGADRPELEMTGDDYRLTMPMPMPSRRTGRGFKVDIQDNGGAMIKPREATLSAQPLAVDLVPLKWRASADSTGTLSFADVRLPFAGQWQFAVDVLIDDFTTVRFERAIEFVPKSQAETPVVSSAAAQGARPVAAAERLR